MLARHASAPGKVVGASGSEIRTDAGRVRPSGSLGLVPAVAACAAGAWALQQQATLPPLGGAFGILAVGTVAVMWLRARSAGLRMLGTVFAVLACGGAGFFWAAGHAWWRLADRLPLAWEGRDIRVEGVVAGLPERTARGWRFRFDVTRVLTPEAHVPARISLAWFDQERDPVETLALAAPVEPGERWRLTLRLKRPRATANPHAFDYEAWLLERGVRAVGYVRDGTVRERLEAAAWQPRYAVERARAAIRTAMLRALGDRPYAGVLVALAIGDQQSISARQWQVFTRTGVNHLMSISGLHVTMVAAIGVVAAGWAWRRAPRLTAVVPAPVAAATAGLLVALAYAMLAGFAVPARRTVWMLGVVAAAQWLRLDVGPARILAVALGAVLLLDPMAVLAAGFWLSFGAVALMMLVSTGRGERGGWLAAWGRTQWALFVGLLPLLVVLFNQVSVVAPIANAVAVPWVSFVVVPLALLTAVVPVVPVAWLAHTAMWPIGESLAWLSQLPQAVWAQHTPPAWAAALAAVGALWLLLPRGFPARWLGALGMLPMVVGTPPRPDPGAAAVTVLDVGQGLAAVVRTRNNALVFDTGPAWSPDADSGSRIVAPYLRGVGVRSLDGLVLSHDDADHTGGARGLLAAVPVGWIATPLPEDHPAFVGKQRVLPCAAGQAWTWDGVRLEMLHPAPASYGRGDLSDNARSCVLKVTSGGGSVLIAADIERASEAWLVTQAARLRADVLVVPHHGSGTSSTPEFIRAVDPAVAVFTVGYRNRFGHPKAEVLQRYLARGIEVARTDADGAVEVILNPSGWSLERWRQRHARYWRGL